MEGKVDADEHFVASRGSFLFSAMLPACRKTRAQTAPLQHFFCVSLSTTSPPTAPQPHLTIRGYKEQCCLLAKQPLSPPSDLCRLLLTTSRYCEVFRIHLGLILAVASVQ